MDAVKKAEALRKLSAGGEQQERMAELASQVPPRTLLWLRCPHSSAGRPPASITRFVWVVYSNRRPASHLPPPKRCMPLGPRPHPCTSELPKPSPSSAHAPTHAPALQVDKLRHAAITSMNITERGKLAEVLYGYPGVEGIALMTQWEAENPEATFILHNVFRQINEWRAFREGQKANPPPQKKKKSMTHPPRLPARPATQSPMS